jgi:hypothetical protein
MHDLFLNPQLERMAEDSAILSSATSENESLVRGKESIMMEMMLWANVRIDGKSCPWLGCKADRIRSWNPVFTVILARNRTSFTRRTAGSTYLASQVAAAHVE